MWESNRMKLTWSLKTPQVEGEQPDLLVSRLHAEEDEICRGTGQTALQVRLSSDLFCLCVKVVQRLHGVLEQSTLDLQDI